MKHKSSNHEQISPFHCREKRRQDYYFSEAEALTVNEAKRSKRVEVAMFKNIKQ